MGRIRQGTICLATLSDNDVAILARYGDCEATSHLWQMAVAQVGRVAGLFIRRYPWVDHEDLSQTVLAEFPKMLARYNPERARLRGIAWNKYLYFAIYRACQDALRREDPLGVKIPQKAKYPSWRRFSEISESNNLVEQIVLDGLQKIDRGDQLAPADEMPLDNHLDGRIIHSPDYHDYVYHGMKRGAKYE